MREQPLGQQAVCKAPNVNLIYTIRRLLKSMTFTSTLQTRRCSSIPGLQRG